MKIDRAAGELLERGVELGQIEDVPHGRAVRFRDPEGNVVQVHEPA